MKRPLVHLSMAACLVGSVGAYGAGPGAQSTPASQAPKTEIVAQANRADPAAAAKNTTDTPTQSNVTPAVALRLMVLRWMVTR